MKRIQHKMMWAVSASMLLAMCCPMLALAAEEAKEYVPSMYASFWSLIPPVVAIVLALITKEVYSSLFVGILIGGVFYSGFTWEDCYIRPTPLRARCSMCSRTGSSAPCRMRTM